MPVNAKNLTSAAEAVLFSVGEPLEIGKLARCSQSMRRPAAGRFLICLRLSTNAQAVYAF